MRGLVRRLRFRTLNPGWRAPRGGAGSGAPADAVRPLGLVTLGQETLDAWFCHPPAAVTDDVRAVAGRLVVPVGLLPEGRRTPATIQVTTEGCAADGRRVTEATLCLRAADAGRWHRLTCPLPPDVQTIRVRTSIIDGPGDWAWAVIGAPEFDVRRSAHEQLTLARQWIGRSRQYGLGAAITQARARLVPQATGPSYSDWRRRHEPGDAELAAQVQAVRTWAWQPLVSIITPAYNTAPAWISAAYASLVRQTYTHWEWSVCDDASTDPASRQAWEGLPRDPRVRVGRRDTNSGIAAASNDALAQAQGEVIALLDHDDELPPWALWEAVAALAAHPGADALYSDEDKLDESGARCEPYFKPDWSPELLRATNYACHLTVVRRAVLDRVGGFEAGVDGAQDHDLWLRLLDAGVQVHHVPKVLYHWRKVAGSTATAHHEKPWADDAGQRALTRSVVRNQWPVAVEPGATAGRYRLRQTTPPAPTSVLMPTFGATAAPAGHARAAARAIASLADTRGATDLEFVLATDDGTVPAEVGRALAGLPHHVVAVPGAFNFSARINAAAARATRPVLLLANDDIEAPATGWLEALADYIRQPGVGAVGPRLDLPDGRLQHAGLVLGVCGIAAHAFHHSPGAAEGYFGALITPRNVSAVTAACLLTTADVFAAVGQFDLRLPIDFNDVDYCLRVWRSGRRVVYTPHARLVHHESASLGLRVPSPEAVALMRERWGTAIERDPFHNPNLTKADPGFGLV